MAEGDRDGGVRGLDRRGLLKLGAATAAGLLAQRLPVMEAGPEPIRKLPAPARTGPAPLAAPWRPSSRPGNRS